jgi:hypothetical protein
LNRGGHCLAMPSGKYGRESAECQSGAVPANCLPALHRI